MNKYVNFVSDEIFLEEVKKVIDNYPFPSEIVTPSNILKNSKHGIDEFKLIFDICVNQMTLENWAKAEKIRQNGKTIENKMGEFHQQLLGRVDGWIDLGVGDDTHVDLMNENGTIFIELKNKKNTINGDSGKQVRNKLEAIVEKNEDAICYWAFIIQKSYKSEDVVWIKKGFQTNERIRKISCDKVYELITGDPNALKETYEALPKAISTILNKEIDFSEQDIKILEEFKELIFNNLI